MRSQGAVMHQTSLYSRPQLALKSLPPSSSKTRPSCLVWDGFLHPAANLSLAFRATHSLEVLLWRRDVIVIGAAAHELPKLT